MSIEQTLLELEEELWRANREGDGAFYDKMLRADALGVSRYGLYDKDQAVKLINVNDNPFTRSAISDAKVRVVNETAALVTYKVDYTALIDGAEQDFTALATSVYSLEDGEWRVVLHQQS
ncbi:nuclear transport factor 2 family protein [Kibdelosporangium philippinense]|uniref:Nuclear transport factor 2 family protein n=1 Tax=Kibdelosporangium philippinense TaxID=211113 RepID=A0ABS8ZF69_9PSEU|nr:nuclear transport factor 2 family protein [Kibdelosporangium philippinense]MCE7006469.1 nuclear transport factor 2 family protein [Kibdelosporangium philippinense]